MESPALALAGPWGWVGRPSGSPMEHFEMERSLIPDFSEFEVGPAVIECRPTFPCYPWLDLL